MIDTTIEIKYRGRREVDAVQRALETYADYLQEIGDSLPDLPFSYRHDGFMGKSYIEAADRVKEMAVEVANVLEANKDSEW